jgi:hypothetical protein
MRTVTVTIPCDGVELTYDVRYQIEICRNELGPYAVPIIADAQLVEVNGEPATTQQASAYEFNVHLREFDRAVLDADADKYPVPTCQDAINTDTRI